MSLEQELRNLIKGGVSTDPKTLDHYSRDWSLFQVIPKLVVFPKDTEDIQALVKWGKLSLTARAAGTDMSGGPLGEGVIMDFTKYINKLKEVGSDFAIVEPGMYYRDFEKEVARYGLLFPSYTASKSLCAIGGMVANNAGGEKSLTYGKTERWVKEIKMVCADGEEHTFSAEHHDDPYSKQIYALCTNNYALLQSAKPKVSKNSAGYALWNVIDKEKNIFDMTQLITGSQGTLGIITEVTLKLVRPKEHSALLVLMIDQKHFGDLGKIILKTLEFKPESLESYDDHTFKIAVKYLPSMIRSMGAGNLISLGLQFLPEVWMAMTGGIPKIILVAEFTGDSEEEIYQKARAAESDIKPFGIRTHIAKNDQEESKYWTIRRQSFKLLTDHSHGQRTLPFIDDIVVNPEHLPEFLPRLQEIMSHYDLTFTIAGHAGDGNFHIIPLDKIGDQKLKTIVPELSEKVFDLVAEYKGSLTGEHNDGLVRTPYLNKMFSPEVLQLFAEVKKIFDPKNIFNPGKKTGETLDYEVKHIDLDPTRHW
ncbi:MAG: FAD-binding oxidoreductase [Patescibacteria group bacterium]